MEGIRIVVRNTFLELDNICQGPRRAVSVPGRRYFRSRVQSNQLCDLAQEHSPNFECQSGSVSQGTSTDGHGTNENEAMQLSCSTCSSSCGSSACKRCQECTGCGVKPVHAVIQANSNNTTGENLGAQETSKCVQIYSTFVTDHVTDGELAATDLLESGEPKLLSSCFCSSAAQTTTQEEVGPGSIGVKVAACTVCGKHGREVCKYWLAHGSCSRKDRCSFCHHTTADCAEYRQHHHDAAETRRVSTRHHKTRTEEYDQHLLALDAHQTASLCHAVLSLEPQHCPPINLAEIMRTIIEAAREHCGSYPLAIQVMEGILNKLSTSHLDWVVGQWRLSLETAKQAKQIKKHKGNSKINGDRVRILTRIFKMYFHKSARPSFPNFLDQGCKTSAEVDIVWPTNVPKVPFRGVIDQFCWHLSLGQLRKYWVQSMKPTQYPMQGILIPYNRYLTKLANTALAESHEGHLGQHEAQSHAGT